MSNEHETDTPSKADFNPVVQVPLHPSQDVRKHIGVGHNLGHSLNSDQVVRVPVFCLWIVSDEIVLLEFRP